MALNLPPASLITQSEENFRSVYQELTRVIAGHPGALTTYTFYEEIDDWLGPWGEKGYPIAYGKFYNIAFSENKRLQNHAVARRWVWKTTIHLQEAIREFIVKFFRSRPLASLTEPILRQAAFDSHPQAYDKGGLTTIALVAPELIPVIAAIPASEFDPRSRDFEATILQVLETAGLVATKGAGSILAALAGPAHNGMFRRAAQQDRRRLRNQIFTSNRLASLKQRIFIGDMDYIPMLDKVINELNQTEFPSQGYARAAREVITEAQNRKLLVRAKTKRLLDRSPEIKKAVIHNHPESLGIK